MDYHICEEKQCELRLPLSPLRHKTDRRVTFRSQTPLPSSSFTYCAS